MQLHPMRSGHVAGAVPAVFGAVGIQAFTNPSDHDIRLTLQVDQSTVELGLRFF
ncbi:hypothetical protein D3C85_1943900 [compost metagenome]